MKLVDKILFVLGIKKFEGRELRELISDREFTPLIKIDGKEHFNDLTLPEVGLMIDAFLDDGDEYFDPLAFNDFLHAELSDETLKSIQTELNAKAFIPQKGDKWSEIDKGFLSALSAKLKDGAMV